MLVPRIATLQTKLQELGYDGAMFTSPPDVNYLSNYWTLLSPVSPQALIVPATGKPTLIFPALELSMAREMCGDSVNLSPWRDYALAVDGVVIDPSPFNQLVLDALPASTRRIGVDYAGLSRELESQLVDGRGIELVDAGDLVQTIRQTKSEAEIDLLRKSAGVVSDSVYRSLRDLKAGDSENDLAAAIAGEIYRRGGKPTHIVVGSGPRGAHSHPMPTDRSIGEGDLVMVDVGIEFDGYWTEIARTIAVGEPGEEARRHFDLVYKAQKAGEASLVAGALGSEIDNAIREVFQAEGIDGNHFFHSSGHGLGLRGADLPHTHPISKTPLTVPSVMSLEPALYFPGMYGIRIEDAFLVTEFGVERLTTHPITLSLD